MTGFATGAAVLVLDRPATGHVRVPRFIRGKQGSVHENVGAFLNPEELAFGRTGGPVVPVYRVAFRQHDVWPDYAGAPQDTLLIEIPEHWLQGLTP